MIKKHIKTIKKDQIPDPEKYKQMILAFLREGGEMSVEKLASFLYLADFNTFYKDQKSMSGMEYRKLKEGEIQKYFADRFKNKTKAKTK